MNGEITRGLAETHLHGHMHPHTPHQRRVPEWLAMMGKLLFLRLVMVYGDDACAILPQP